MRNSLVRKSAVRSMLVLTASLIGLAATGWAWKAMPNFASVGRHRSAKDDLVQLERIGRALQLYREECGYLPVQSRHT